jgi:hypothetical protein
MRSECMELRKIHEQYRVYCGEWTDDADNEGIRQMRRSYLEHRHDNVYNPTLIPTRWLGRPRLNTVHNIG